MRLNHYLIFTADFGLSKIIDEQVTMKTVCGTPGYCGELWINSYPNENIIVGSGSS